MPQPSIQESHLTGTHASRTASRGTVRTLLFGSAVVDSAAANFGLLATRVIVGLSLAFAHGIGKMPPSEGFIGGVEAMGMHGSFAWLGGFAEFGGGILLALGLFTRPVALLLCGHMLVIFFLAHAGDPFGDREMALLYGAVALLYLLVGAGRYSIDRLLRGPNAVSR